MTDSPDFLIYYLLQFNYRFFDFPKNSIFQRDSSVLIKEITLQNSKSELPIIMSRMVIMISLLGNSSDLAD